MPRCQAGKGEHATSIIVKRKEVPLTSASSLVVVNNISSHQFIELKRKCVLQFDGMNLFYLIRMVEEDVKKFLPFLGGFDPSTFENIMYFLFEKTLPDWGL